MSEMNEFNVEVQSRIMGEDLSNRNARVKVFGVGGAGGNTVNRMKQMNIDGVEYYAVNTDAMALDLSLADHKIVIGEKSTRNLGAGMDPEKGRKAAEENVEEIREAMKGADMVFVTAGMGGGTGTGAAPVVAAIAREMGILTVAVVTTPFRFEGNARTRLAKKGIAELRAAADTIIVVENKKLLTTLQAANQKAATMDEAFKMADEILGNGVHSICGIMNNHGLVHVDFADIRKVMQDGGSALMGTGCAQGENRGIIAADLALASPLLEDISVEGAKGVLINVAHGENFSIFEYNDAMEHIYEKVGEEGDPNIIIGDITVPELGEKVSITIIATGCGGVQEMPSVQDQASMPLSRTGQMFNTPFSSQSAPTVPMNAVPKAAAPQAAPVQPAVQQSTPRPTAFNVFDFASASQPAPQPAQQSAPEMFTRQAPAQRVNVAPVAAAVATAVEEAPVVTAPSISESQAFPAVGSVFAGSGFNAQQPAEETIVGKSETSEIAALSDEDEYNGGRGTSGSITSALDAPAYTRQQEVALKADGVDYTMPAYLRMGDMENF